MIQIRELSVTLDGKEVLKDIDLDIRPRENFVILGRSGSGKTVLLRAISGLLVPDHGEVLIDGKNLLKASKAEELALRSKITMVFQGSALFDSLTVGENVGFFLSEHTILKRAQIQQRVKECLDLVGLKDVEALYPEQLSGGMQKRVAIARALSFQPQVLLYDEPTSGIDPITADLINDFIITFRRQLGVTTVVVTHDIESAYKIADRIALLFGGEIIFCGTKDALLATSDARVRQFIEGRHTGPILNWEV